MDWNAYCNAVYRARCAADDAATNHRANILAHLDCLDRLHEAMCEHACDLYARFPAYLDHSILVEAEDIRESMMFIHRAYNAVCRTL